MHRYNNIMHAIYYLIIKKTMVCHSMDKQNCEKQQCSHQFGKSRMKNYFTEHMVLARMFLTLSEVP